MPRVIYILHTGVRREVDVPSGKSIMRGAVENRIGGVEAICGGECACGTCHVYVDPPYLQKLKPAQETEEALLGCVAAERRPNSRLSCQLIMSDELSGITVHLPHTQS